MLMVTIKWIRRQSWNSDMITIPCFDVYKNRKTKTLNKHHQVKSKTWYCNTLVVCILPSSWLWLLRNLKIFRTIFIFEFICYFFDAFLMMRMNMFSVFDKQPTLIIAFKKQVIIHLHQNRHCKVLRGFAWLCVDLFLRKLFVVSFMLYRITYMIKTFLYFADNATANRIISLSPLLFQSYFQSWLCLNNLWPSGIALLIKYNWLKVKS